MTNRTLTQAKSRSAGRLPLVKRGGGRLSLRAALLVWLGLAALGWLAIIYGVPLLV